MATMSTAKKGERFTTLRLLSEDPIGRWELAADTQTSQTVAMRRLRARLFPDAAAAQAFLAKVKSLAADRREGFQRIIALGTSGGEPWIACAASEFGTVASIVGTAGVDPQKLADQFAVVAARLDALHASGGIHGDLRPDTLFFDADGSLLIGERATLHALFGWEGAPVRLPDGAVGTRVRADRLAPETVRTGIIDARSDQYALAICLAECLGFRAGAWPAGTSAALQGVFRFALSANPADRHPSCAAMVDAVRQSLQASRRPNLRKYGLVAAAAVAMIAAFLGGSSVGAARSATRTEAAKETLRATVAEPFLAALRKVASAPVVASLKPGTERESAAYDGFTGSRVSQQERALRAQYGRLMAASRLRLDVDFAEKADVTARGGEPAAVLISETDVPKFGQAASPIAWKLKLQLPDVGKPLADYRVVLRALNDRREPIGPEHEFPLDLARAEQTSTLEGKIDPPAGGWRPGSAIGFDASLRVGKNEEKWQNFGIVTATRFEWTSSEASVSPGQVYAMKAAGFAVKAGVDLVGGDLVRVKATGTVRPTSDERYKLMGLEPIDNGPEGMKVTSPNIRKCKIVSESQGEHWGGLLMRFGEKGAWALFPAAAMRVDEAQAGPVFLSIDSVTHQADSKGVYKLVPDDKWWQDGGAFQVSLERGRLIVPQGAIGLQAAQEKVLDTLSRRLGVESSAGVTWSEEKSLAGAWEADDGTRLQISDNGATVRLQATSSEKFRKLDFTFAREGTDLFDRGCTFSLASDPRGRTLETDGRLVLVDFNNLVLTTESVAFEGEELAERHRDGLQMTFGRVAAKKVVVQTPKPVGGTTKPEEVKKGLFAIDFSGTWIASDYGCRLRIVDDGKKIVVTSIQSIEFNDLYIEIEKSETEFKVLDWRVMYEGDNIRPRRVWDNIKAKVTLQGPNILMTQSDLLRFDRNTGAFLSKLNYGNRVQWRRVPQFQVGAPSPYTIPLVPGVIPQPGKNDATIQPITNP